jgi:hypothetical protein
MNAERRKQLEEDEFVIEWRAWRAHYESIGLEFGIM